MEDLTLCLTSHMGFEKQQKKCYKSCKLLLSTETRKLSVFGSGPAKSIPEQSENEMHCTKPFFKLEVDVFKVYIKAGKY